MTVLFSTMSAGKILNVIVVSLALSGCGGGGGGGGSASSLPSHPPSCVTTVEGCLTATE